jgi:ribosomal protein S18 acetylase RimI-like enzyme
VIRSARAEDIDELWDVFRRSSLSNDGDRAALLANPDVFVFDESGVHEHRTRVALADDGRILGFSTVRVESGVGELEDLFVDPDCMRRGIGSELIADAAARARAEGLARIEVTANEHARAFYETVGFVLDGVAETLLAPGLRMHLDLGS